MNSSSKNPKDDKTQFEKKGYFKPGNLANELKREKYFLELKIPKAERLKIAKDLFDPQIFGSLIGINEKNKVESLIKELKIPGFSSDSRIREVAENIRKKYGREKAKKIAEIVEEQLFGKNVR